MKKFYFSLLTFISVFTLFIIFKIRWFFLSFDSLIRFSSQFSILFSRKDKKNLYTTLRAINFCSFIFLPRNCLVSSSVLKKIYPLTSDLKFYIGIKKTEEGGFNSHSWVELDNVVILGNLKDLHHFKRIHSY